MLAAAGSIRGASRAPRVMVAHTSKARIARRPRVHLAVQLRLWLRKRGARIARSSRLLSSGAGRTPRPALPAKGRRELAARARCGGGVRAAQSALRLGAGPAAEPRTLGSLACQRPSVSPGSSSPPSRPPRQHEAPDLAGRLGRNRGEIRWPPTGRSGDRRWGLSVAAHGEIPMAAVTLLKDACGVADGPVGGDYAARLLDRSRNLRSLRPNVIRPAWVRDA